MEKSKYKLFIGFVILTAVILVIAIVGFFIAKPEPYAIQGEVDAREVRISGKIAGRIESFPVQLGDNVHKGDTLVFIDSPEIRAKIAQAEAAKSAASAVSTKARNGTRSEQIQAAYELWQQALVQEDVMRKSFNRIDNLYSQKVVSEQKYDETKAKYDAAVAQTKAAKSQYDMAVNGARREDKEAAAAQVDQAQGVLQELDSYYSELSLTAPCDGVITDIYPEVGELVGQGAPIMNISDMTDVWFVFNIREDFLHGLNYGDKIRVRIPSLGDKEVTATVNFINVRESYATWKATKETSGYDAKTFEVRAVPDESVEGIHVGMSAVVKDITKHD